MGHSPSKEAKKMSKVFPEIFLVDKSLSTKPHSPECLGCIKAHGAYETLKAAIETSTNEPSIFYNPEFLRIHKETFHDTLMDLDSDIDPLRKIEKIIARTKRTAMKIVEVGKIGDNGGQESSNGAEQANVEVQAEEKVESKGDCIQKNVSAVIDELNVTIEDLRALRLSGTKNAAPPPPPPRPPVQQAEALQSMQKIAEFKAESARRKARLVRFFKEHKAPIERISTPIAPSNQSTIQTPLQEKDQVQHSSKSVDQRKRRKHRKRSQKQTENIPPVVSSPLVKSRLERKKLFKVAKKNEEYICFFCEFENLYKGKYW